MIYCCCGCHHGCSVCPRCGGTGIDPYRPYYPPRPQPWPVAPWRPWPVVWPPPRPYLGGDAFADVARARA